MYGRIFADVPSRTIKGALLGTILGPDGPKQRVRRVYDNLA